MTWQTVCLPEQDCVYWQVQCSQEYIAFNALLQEQETLEDVFAAEVPEIRYWAVDEALAEALQSMREDSLLTIRQRQEKLLEQVWSNREGAMYSKAWMIINGEQ